MDDISPEQCRAARSLLWWTQADLAAKTGVAKRTVGNFEGNLRPLARRTRRAIVEAFKRAGIVFEPEGGVRRDLPGHGVQPFVDRKRADNASTRVQDLLEIAKRWRMRAEEYRTLSSSMRTPSAREAYARLARTYEEMARHTEERAQGMRQDQQTA